MDDAYKGNVLPTQRTPPCKDEMPTVAKVASGPVDMGSGKSLITKTPDLG